MHSLRKIFIIHYTKLKERKAHMLEELHRWFPEVNYEFVEDFDQEDLTPKIIEENFYLENFEKRFDRKMLRSEMSLCMKYKKAVSDISNSEDGEQFFILEDDVIFKEDPLRYIEAMNNLCDSKNINYDCVFLGEAWIRKGDNRDIFGKKEHPATNGLCTVLYKKNSLKKLDTLLKENKITQPMDWELNDRFRDLGFQVYWGKAITKHGSVLAAEDKNFKPLKSSLREKY
jgi:GR25 family glycosyltransferase involved in LPS biosynthesis